MNMKHFISKASRMFSTGPKPFTILVEGNLGCGKTTFLNHFRNNENILTVTEPVEAWRNVQGHNLFDLMYNDPKQWGFTFQTYVQLSMTKLHDLPTERPVKMMERSIFSARYIFVENLSKEGIISKPQEVVLDEWFSWLTMQRPIACDLIVYLRAEPEIVYKRMVERSRFEERNVSLEYVQKIHKYHEDWLFHKTAFSLPAPVLILDANKGLKDMMKEYNTCEKVLKYQMPLC